MPIEKRNYKHEYALQKKRGEDDERAKRQIARRRYDKAGIDREGKHVAHTVALSNGGSNAPSNTRLTSPRANLSFERKSNHKPKK